jgi:hypothetical protein
MSGETDGARLSRAAKNEQAFQQHNERRAQMEQAGGSPDDEPVPFACECDDPTCAHAIMIPLEEYEAAVKPVDQFVVIPGHEDPTVERVVDRHDRYFVVSKPELKRR